MRTASIARCSSSRVKNPARARHRRARRRRHVVHAGDQHAGGAARRFDAIEQRRQRDALPVGGADQAEVARVGVAGAFHQVASAARDQRFEVAQASEAGACTSPASVSDHAEGSACGAAVRTKNSSVGVGGCGLRLRRAQGGVRRSKAARRRSVKSRASRPSPRRRPNGGALTPGATRGTARIRRASDVWRASVGSRRVAERKSRRFRGTAQGKYKVRSQKYMVLQTRIPGFYFVDFVGQTVPWSSPFVTLCMPL